MWDHTDATPLERPPGFNTLVIAAEEAAEIQHTIDKVEEDRTTPTEPTDRLLEYSCHEANYSMRFILEAARMQDERSEAVTDTVERTESTTVSRFR